MDKTTTLEKLILAHKELLFHHEELERCNANLVVANKKLNKKEQGHQKLTTSLQDANSILLNENKKKDKSSIQLELANATLKKAAEIQHTNKQDLEKIMYLLSHKIRKEVANILGISNLLIEHADLTPTEISEMMNIIIYSAQSLNLFTEDISLTIHKKR